MDNGVIVGQFAAPTGADAEHFSMVLAKGSPLTACVNQAIASLKADGTLDQITTTWLSDKASAPGLPALTRPQASATDRLRRLP